MVGASVTYAYTQGTLGLHTLVIVVRELWSKHFKATTLILPLHRMAESRNQAPTTTLMVYVVS